MAEDNDANVPPPVRYAAKDKKRRSATASEEPRKRRQLPVSCHFCRSKKLKCDRHIPCESCTKRGIQDTCMPAAVVESEAQILVERRPAVATSSTVKRKISTSDFFNRAATGKDLLLIGDETLVSESVVGEISTAILEMVFSFRPRTTKPLRSIEILEYLPPMSQALRFLDHYADKVSWSFALVHHPTLRTNLKQLYHEVETSQTINAAKASLVCTVLGLSAHFYTPSLTDEDSAKRHARNLFNMARKCLQCSGFPETPTLDTLQAVTLMAYFSLSLNLEVNKMLVFSSLADIASRTFRMHQLDLPRNKERRVQDSCNQVEVELMRRLWWSLTASEWLHAETSGILRYSIHPSHFCVEYPTHADNSALDAQGVYARPLSVPTDLSYFLTRLRFAEISRYSIDLCAEAGCSTLADLEYDEVLRLDSKLRAMWAEIPSFYRLDEDSQKANEVLLRERPYIAYDIFIMYIGYHSRLSSLHRPYLAKALKDERFALSRTISLDAARTAIHFGKQMHLSDLDVSPALLNLSTATKNLFMAILVLAMDYHFNDKSPALRQEIVEASKTLERGAAQNPIARRGLAQLRAALDEWKHTIVKSSEKSVALNDSENDAQDTVRDIVMDGTRGKDHGSAGMSFSDQDDPLLQWLDSDMTLDLMNWDSLLTQLGDS